ncbi:hypothetical protein RFI_08872 [Reticulomyxa filosa]|uniref:Uncharacterized protein n=1 Tax=Reticulomyxa filosa TaxID=46433 RepID=X6NQG5_RETFI|nr:hypothetical protein RFI_08872 [Reticulomyxa filosa]|eukprot:ETO28261.1 hypothetical protein RFI_08872 [Reticulomyxa filosa]
MFKQKLKDEKIELPKQEQKRLFQKNLSGLRHMTLSKCEEIIKHLKMEQNQRQSKHSKQAAKGSSMGADKGVPDQIAKGGNEMKHSASMRNGVVEDNANKGTENKKKKFGMDMNHEIFGEAQSTTTPKSAMSSSVDNNNNNNNNSNNSNNNNNGSNDSHFSKLSSQFICGTTRRHKPPLHSKHKNDEYHPQKKRRKSSHNSGGGNSSSSCSSSSSSVYRAGPTTTTTTTTTSKIQHKNPTKHKQFSKPILSLQSNSSTNVNDLYSPVIYNNRKKKKKALFY